LALQEAIPIARQLGVAVAGVRNANEFGRAAYYVEAAAAEGFIALICGNTLPLLGAPGARTATHGNNPLAYAVPGEAGPLFDACWTPRSGGEVSRRRLLGLPLLEEWGYLDSNGEPTTDPSAVGVMPAAGGAKGFGIALLVDILAGALTGAASGPDVPRDNHNVGAFILLLSPSVFADGTNMAAPMRAAAAAVHSSGARWPGERSSAARQRNAETGWVHIPRVVLQRATDAMGDAAPSLAGRLAALGSSP
jgi:LDH2 family malate/lactate/ureidoglycolate dehydrogenase